jgi:hypothetical protein
VGKFNTRDGKNFLNNFLSSNPKKLTQLNFFDLKIFQNSKVSRPIPFK